MVRRGTFSSGRLPGGLAAAGLLVLWALAGPAAAAEVEFEATVDRTEVPLNGRVTLTLSSSVPDRSRVDYLQLPDTGSLRLVSRSQERKMSFSFSGGASRYRRFTNTVVVLQPTEKGRVTIGAAEMKYAGKVYRTEPITIAVSDARSRRRPAPTSPVPGMGRFPDDDWFDNPLLGRRRQAVAEDDLFVRAYAAPDVAVVGQQVTVTLTIYSRVGARIAGFRWPQLDPFYSVSRDVSKAPTEEKYIDGVRFQYKVLARRALFPLRAGELTIGPIEVDAEASHSPFFPSEQRTLRTRPLKIKVEPLPPGAPEGFHSTNVGRFSLQSELDARQVKLNQPLTYTLTVRGTGNIQNLRPPRLPELDRFKVFDPSIDVEQTERGSKVRGAKTFEYILLPLASGSLTIPSLSFSYYDPRAGAYRTLETEAYQIEVAAGADGGAGAGGGHEFNIVAGAFKPIRFDSDLRGYGAPFYAHPAFVPLVVLPPLAYALLLLGLLFRSLLRIDSPRGRMRRAAGEARRHWRLAAKAARSGDAGAYYLELKEALLRAIESRTGRPAQGLQWTELAGQLRAAGVPEAVIEQLERELENCDFGRFAPAAARGGEMASATARADRLIKDLQRRRAAAAPHRRRAWR